MKKRKFGDGGEIDPMEAANASAESQDIAASVPAGPTAEPAPELSFKGAFAEARAAGDKTFVWRGKKFTTDIKKFTTDIGSSSKGGSGRGKVNPTTAGITSKGRINSITQDDLKDSKRFTGMGSMKFAKGGSVKGWGQARGARAAKIV